MGSLSSLLVTGDRMSNFFNVAACSSLVEFYGLAQLIVGDRRSDVELLQCSCLLLFGCPVQLGDDVLALCLCLSSAFLLRTHLLQGRLDQVIQPETLSILKILHHEVSKALNVPRSCQYRFRGQHSAIHLKHLLFKYKMVPPSSKQVGFHGTAHWTKVVLSCHPAIDGERLVIEKPPLEGILHLGPVELSLDRPQCHLLVLQHLLPSL